MVSQRLDYSEERGTWNLFVDSGYGWEWYFEGTYEQCEEMMFNNLDDDEYQYREEDVLEYESLFDWFEAQEDCL